MSKNMKLAANLLGSLVIATFAHSAMAEATNPLTAQQVGRSNTTPLTINVSHGSNLNTAGNMAWADGGSTTTNGNLWGMNVAYADLEITAAGTYQITASSDLMHPGFTLWNAGLNAIGTWNAYHVYGQTSSATESVSGTPGRTFDYVAHANPGAAFTTGNAGTGAWAVTGQTIGAAGINSGDTIIGNGSQELTSLTLFLEAGHYLFGVGGACPGGTATCSDLGTKGFKAVSVSVSAVPVPAAVWLFGSALAGLGIVGRRKDQISSAG